MIAIAGTYWNRKEDDFTAVLIKDNKLQVDLGVNDCMNSSPSRPLTSTSSAFPGATTSTSTSSPPMLANPASLEQTYKDGNPTSTNPSLPSIPLPPSSPKYQGAYTSEEIDPTYRITLADGKLQPCPPQTQNPSLSTPP